MAGSVGQGAGRLALQLTLYDSANPTRRWLHRQRRAWLLGQIGAGRWRSALEVGPGSGVYLAALAAAANAVLAVDVDETFLQRARELGAGLPNLRWQRDDITASALPAAAFDLILCTEVIEHLADSTAALAGLAGRLAPGGTLLLTTPQRYSPLECCARVALLPGLIQLVRLCYREPVLELGHINLLTESALRRQLAAAGWEVEAQYKCGFYLPLVAELGGEWGRRLLAACERRLRGTRLDWLLWTQCYRLRRRTVSAARRDGLPPGPEQQGGGHE